jgi:hypothetical protein
MEKIINWIDVSRNSSNISKLDDLEFYVYRKLNAKPASQGNYLQFSNFLSTIYSDSKYLKVGKIGEKLVIMFNNDSGIKIHKSGTRSSILRVNSTPFVNLIFKNYGLDKMKPHNFYKLKDLGDNTFLIDKV